MGNFYGHLAPGVFFIVFGVLWTVQIWKRYLKSFTKNGKPFQCELSPPVEIRGISVNVEGIFVVIFTIGGMLIEFRHIYLGGEIGITRAQHGTMYIFFLMVGIMKLLNLRLKRLLPNIDELEYVVFAMALTVEAILFKFHLMERDMLDTTIHVLLVNSIYGCIIMTLVEMVFRKQVLLALGRAFFILLQGTWFCQVAFILYSPIPAKSGVYNTKWDHEDHHQIMLTTCMYTWHLGCILIFSLCCGFLWACVYRKRGELGDTELRTVEPVTNGYMYLVNNEEEADEEHVTNDEIKG